MLILGGGGVDIGKMDPEDFQHEWRQARNSWEQASQHKLETEAAGRQLTEPELASWRAAKASFDEYEQAWEQAYKMGVVILVEGDDDEEDGDPGR
ncbi:MAG TPA: hypothetical protein VGD91_04785 [Trebonia sp.]